MAYTLHNAGQRLFPVPSMTIMIVLSYLKANSTTELSQKFCNIFLMWGNNLAVLNAFAKGVKVTNHTGLWDGKLAWYSLSATLQIFPYDMKQSLGIHSFKPTGWILGVAAGLGASPQVQRDQGLASEEVLWLCTHLSLPPSSPNLNPLDYFVWSYIENITNMTSHNTKASLIAAIRQARTGACGKGMLPVPDPYRGGDWGWRRLHWIDVSSNT